MRNRLIFRDWLQWLMSERDRLLAECLSLKSEVQRLKAELKESEKPHIPDFFDHQRDLRQGRE